MSFINRIYGCHKLTMPSGYEVNVIVLANVLYTDLKINERYDLKVLPPPLRQYLINSKCKNHTGFVGSSRSRQSASRESR